MPTGGGITSSSDLAVVEKVYIVLCLNDAMPSPFFSSSTASCASFSAARSRKGKSANDMRTASDEASGIGFITKTRFPVHKSIARWLLELLVASFLCSRAKAIMEFTGCVVSVPTTLERSSFL